MRNKKRRLEETAFFIKLEFPRLLDLGFLELDVFSNNRVILVLRHLVRHRAAVLRRDVEETRIGGRQKLDFDGVSLSHIEIPALF